MNRIAFMPQLHQGMNNNVMVGAGPSPLDEFQTGQTLTLSEKQANQLNHPIRLLFGGLAFGLFIGIFAADFTHGGKGLR